jgi:hypothetical protein
MSEGIVVLVTCGSEEQAANIGQLARPGTLGGLREYHLRPFGPSTDGKQRSAMRRSGCWSSRRRRKGLRRLQKKVTSLHSYSVPEIIALPILEGSESYLKWLEETTE